MFPLVNLKWAYLKVNLDVCSVDKLSADGRGRRQTTEGRRQTAEGRGRRQTADDRRQTENGKRQPDDYWNFKQSKVGNDQLVVGHFRT